MRSFVIAFLSLVCLFPQAKPAHAYDIDCKIILCLPGGFPSGCGDAYDTFIDRITAKPPKPPIGHCPMQQPEDAYLHDEHPDVAEVRDRAIGDEATIRTLRSMKLQYYRSRGMCCSGKECDHEYTCTQTYFIDGDGGNFSIRTINGHHFGTRVDYIGLDGQPAVAGNFRTAPPPPKPVYTGNDK